MTAITQRLLISLAGKPTSVWYTHRLRKEQFEHDPVAAKIFDFMDAFVRTNRKVPIRETINEQFGTNYVTEITEPQWLYDQAHKARVMRTMSLASEEVAKIMKVDPIGATQRLIDIGGRVLGEQTAPKAFNFKHAIDLAWPWFVEKWSGAKPAVPIAWPKLHQMTGGVYGGEMISLVGRSGLGKSWVSIAMAMHIWQVMKRPVLFVSMELMVRKFLERQTSLYTLTPTDFFKDGIDANLFTPDRRKAIQTKLQALRDSDMPDFLIVDGNLSSSVDDIVALMHQIEPAAVFVDGAYLLKVPGRDNLKGFEKIDAICSALKRDVATNGDVATFASWQFNREAAKLKPGQIPELHQIAGGDTIGQISSVVMGLVDDPREGDPTYAGRRRIHILKGRDGESGSFAINWDFVKMNFDEAPEYGGDGYQEYGLAA